MALFGMSVLAGCPRQEEGERCDTRAGISGEDSDCGDGLVCTPSEELGTNADICCPVEGTAPTHEACQPEPSTAATGGAGGTGGTSSTGGAGGTSSAGGTGGTGGTGGSTASSSTAASTAGSGGSGGSGGN